ncbi:TetR/AcrR family transcriptional regulator [Curtobacterium sp. MCBD17_040]|uniref:TetR/AcrR family transcriptional regulator n=1 Tax=Curtobacterium sp. MCBD17_040 TaxID=2175674 RepID=UPI000DAA3521|nr:TetR/AcrR family transcriptional regulator [Curtobacterium sp. MCBD17_040]WIB62724.1 TetR/AcrR family transcriptional regulator [Curtobacterium sp. MCBD17_040]
MTSARDRILDSFVGIVCDDGERVATLDAVAARAGVSKGGLLYHFGSKAALVAGLCERLSDLGVADVERMRAATDGPARYFVSNCEFVGSELDLALLAASRLQQAGYEEAGRTLDEVEGAWLAALVDHLGDVPTAQAIKLMGDGLYHAAALGAVAGGRSRAEGVVMEDILGVVDRLVATRPDA